MLFYIHKIKNYVVLINTAVVMAILNMKSQFIK